MAHITLHLTIAMHMEGMPPQQKNLLRDCFLAVIIGKQDSDSH